MRCSVAECDVEVMLAIIETNGIILHDYTEIYTSFNAILVNNNYTDGPVPIGIRTLFVIEHFALKFMCSLLAHSWVDTHRLMIYYGFKGIRRNCVPNIPSNDLFYINRHIALFSFPFSSEREAEREREIVAVSRERRKRFMGCGAMWCSRINIVNICRTFASRMNYDFMPFKYINNITWLLCLPLIFLSLFKLSNLAIARIQYLRSFWAKRARNGHLLHFVHSKAIYLCNFKLWATPLHFIVVRILELWCTIRANGFQSPIWRTNSHCRGIMNGNIHSSFPNLFIFVDVAISFGSRCFFVTFIFQHGSKC